MSGWVPMPADLWPLMVDRLQVLEEAWPEEACLFDLRWHVDQRKPIPGRPALCARWGVTDRIARRLMADTGRWWDPARGPAPTGRVQPVSNACPTDVQRVSNDRPADTQTNAETQAGMSSRCPADVQPMSSPCPADVHRRVDPPSPSPSHPPSPSPEDERGSAPSADPKPDPAPAWATKAKRPKGVTPLALADAVSLCVAAIRGTAGIAAASNAEPVVSLWGRLGQPPLADFIRDVDVVALAARECPEPMFARDIRAEGWADGTDRSRVVASVCRFGPPPRSQGATWDERVEAARRWEQAGRRRVATPQRAHGPPARGSPRPSAPAPGDMSSLIHAMFEPGAPR
jgi:hypothetical protein